jgi:hypothetical protein
VSTECRPDFHGDSVRDSLILQSDYRLGNDETDVFLETIFEPITPVFFGRLVSWRIRLDVHFPISNLDGIGLNVVSERIERIPTR